MMYLNALSQNNHAIYQINSNSTSEDLDEPDEIIYQKKNQTYNQATLSYSNNPENIDQ